MVTAEGAPDVTSSEPWMLRCRFFLALVTCGTMMIVTVHRYLRRYEELVGGSMR